MRASNMRVGSAYYGCMYRGIVYVIASIMNLDVTGRLMCDPLVHDQCVHVES